MRYFIIILLALGFAACGGVQQSIWPEEEIFEAFPDDRVAPVIGRMYNVSNMYCGQMFNSWPCQVECYYEADGWRTTCEIWTWDESGVLTCTEDLEGALHCEDEMTMLVDN